MEGCEYVSVKEGCEYVSVKEGSEYIFARNDKRTFNI